MLFNKDNKSGFSFVELIVTITILSILATIAVMSVQSLRKYAQNSVRAIDADGITRALNLHHTEYGDYPLPDDYSEVLYNGDLVHYQGYLGKNVISTLRKITEVPIDPKTGDRYIYSVTADKSEFQILEIYENQLANKSPLISSANAGSFSNPQPRINGTYNHVYVKTDNYYIILPSIINSEVTPPNNFILTNDNIKSYVKTHHKNIPERTDIEQVTSQIDMNLVTYTGSVSPNTLTTYKIYLGDAIKSAYSGSVLASEEPYAQLLSMESLQITNDLVLKGSPESQIYDGKTVLGEDFEGSTGDGETPDACDTAIISTSGCNGYTSITLSSGNTYDLTEIGGMCWFADNLKELPNNFSTPPGWANNSNNGWHGYYGEGVEEREEGEGLHYTWAAAMNNPSCIGQTSICGVERSQGVCPSGWHIPSICETSAMVAALGGTDVAPTETGSSVGGQPGKALKKGGGSGFELGLRGYRNNNGAFGDTDITGRIWVSSDFDENLAWVRYVDISNGDFNSNTAHKGNAFHVRCVKD